MDISQPPYEYAPLQPADAIRVLILHPASNPSEKLMVQLKHTTALRALGKYDEDLPIPYEAVSYTWGKPDLSHYLECEGQIIRVTASVDNLLRRLRKFAGDRSLWVDSVCINQQDRDEKEIQVQMMGLIYSRSQKVHVWLGDAVARDRIEWVFSFFKELALSIHSDDEILDWRSGQKNPWEKDSERVIDRFLSRPWFGRRWILQEVILASDVTVRCGRFKMPWQWMSKATQMLNSNLPGRGFLSDASMRALETIGFLNTPSNQILDLMFKFHTSKCSDPRDRIFALYGMASNTKDLPVDYNSPWTKTRSDFAGICMKSGHFLTLLQHLTAFGSLSMESPSLPSWLPNWESTRFSEARFSLSDTKSPSQNCELSSKQPSHVHSRDTLRYVFRDFVKSDHQSASKQPPQNPEGTEHEFQTASRVSSMTIAMLFLHCLQFHKAEHEFSPQHQLAQILSAAIMDIRLHFDKQDEMLKNAKKISPIVIPPAMAFNAPELNPSYSQYTDSLELFEKRFEQDIQEAYKLSEDQATDVLQEISKHERIQLVAELLKLYSLFYTRIDTQQGSYYVPGITSSTIEDGDFVLIPQSKKGEITPSTTAFLLRPVKKERISRNSNDPHFRIVGLCFVAETGNLTELEDSEARGPDSFVIV